MANVLKAVREKSQCFEDFVSDYKVIHAYLSSPSCLFWYFSFPGIYIQTFNFYTNLLVHAVHTAMVRVYQMP